MGIYTVVISVVKVIILFSPLYLIWKNLLGVLNFCAVFLTKLLPESRSTCRAILDTASACHTLILVDMCNICRARHIRSIEELRCTECITDIHVTVTDTENLVLAVDIRNLMDKTVVLSFL